MQVLILAGGLGTRLKSVVQNLPKPMAPVQNRPFLEYLLDFWIDQKATAFYLSTCHLAEKIESHFSKSYRGCSIEQIKEPEPLGTGGGLLYALNKIGLNEDIVVVNGDTFFEIDFERMKAFHKEKKARLTMGLREVQLNNRYSGIELDDTQKVCMLAQRKTDSKHLLINAGVYILNPRWLLEQGFQVGGKYSLEDELFPLLIKKEAVYGFVSKGKFIDIGIPEDYEKAQQFFK
ncbi:MAG: D-glycero-alpha-D-manno-heptose 1-phosphate guanylyltransferase [Chlamydiae bacterium]|nr:D-glycero-alpha-D-manno-heptose 1-phosphate guanylyltransferase [Chlamydiota bacterium]